MILDHAPEPMLKFAYDVATSSPDLSTQLGAVLIRSHIIAWAHNEPVSPLAVTPERLERPMKYAVTCHAEAGTIARCARRGVRTNGATMVCPWAACNACAVMMIAGGVNKLVTHRDAHAIGTPSWVEQIALSMEMFAEAGVAVEWFEGPVPGAPNVRMNERLWSPSTLEFVQ